MKRIVFILFCVVPGISASAQYGSFKNDFKQIGNGIANYLLNVSNLTYNLAPAGVDAGSGCFIDKMNTRSMDRFADPLDEFPFYSELGSRFYEMFYTFSLENQKTFRECGNHISDGMQQHHLLYECTSCNKTHLEDVAYHILKLNLKSDAARPLLEKVKDHINQLYVNVNHDNDRSKDCRANGWITWQVHNAARAGLQHLEAINVNNRESEAGKLGMVMSHFYKELIAMPVQNYDEWLSPEWQVCYFTICYATYLELTAMDYSHSSAAYLDYAGAKLYI
jgi:hypothetical protein